MAAMFGPTCSYTQRRSVCSHAVNKLNAIRWVAAAMRPFAVSSAATCFVSSRRSFPLHSAIASTLINSTVHTHTHTHTHRYRECSCTVNLRGISAPFHGPPATSQSVLLHRRLIRLVHSASAELNKMNWIELPFANPSVNGRIGIHMFSQTFLSG